MADKVRCETDRHTDRGSRDTIYSMDRFRSQFDKTYQLTGSCNVIQCESIVDLFSKSKRIRLRVNAEICTGTTTYIVYSGWWWWWWCWVDDYGPKVMNYSANPKPE